MSDPYRAAGDDVAGGPSVDVLIVGAGPTGLALATQLALVGASFRIIDRSVDRARESRALAVQARTLELLDAAGLADPLVSLGRTSTRLVLHFGGRAVGEAQLGAIGATDTRYPFILFVSQAETERLLGDHLERAGVVIERGVELAGFVPNDTHVEWTLRHQAGRTEQGRARYLVGCDGAHSTVRKNAGFSFAGGTYPQDFVLGDVEADGPLAGGAINAFTGAGGVAMFFPLGTPRTWRVIAMRTATGRQRSREEQPPDAPPAAPLTLEELQEIVAPPTSGTVTVRDPAWLTHFRLHHRQVEHYRRGRVFLAGDAAHIHSPVGAQGMNTGIQDAWNLGWKLALASRSPASERLLDSYEAERSPVGRFLLRYTDRLFATFTRVISGGPVATWAREVVVPRVVPRVIGGGWLRTAAFRFVSELAIRYRKSPAVREGEPRLRRGPRAGDRLPDARLTIDGAETFLQRAAVAPRFTVLLCGRLQPPEDVIAETRRVAERYGRLIDVRVLSTRGGPGSLVDTDGTVLALLGVDDAAQYLIRPDGYVAFRCGGWELRALTQFVDECLARADGGPFRQRTGF